MLESPRRPRSEPKMARRRRDGLIERDEAMQATRERILNILKERGQATVQELSDALDLTTVTIRHHLDTLRAEKLVAAPTVRHREAPGRPQHVYTLTENASDHFPKQYEPLINFVLDELVARFPQEEVASIMTCIGRRLATGLRVPPGTSLDERVSIVVAFMDERGYMASWETHTKGYALHVANCPYESVAARHNEVCNIDCALLTEILGSTVADISRIHVPPHHCTYILEPARGYEL